LLDAGAHDRVARVFDVRSGRPVSQLVQPDTVTTAHLPLRAIASSREARRGCASLARANRNAVPRTDGPHGASSTQSSCHSGNRIVTASTDQTGRVWDANSGDLLTPLSNHRNSVLRAHFSPDDAPS
jgi:WD40 repeat protein